MTATTADLQNMLGDLVALLHKRIGSGEATAADLNVARQTLKDNGITAPALPGTPMGKLAEAFAARGSVVLPFPAKGEVIGAATGTDDSTRTDMAARAGAFRPDFGDDDDDF